MCVRCIMSRNINKFVHISVWLSAILLLIRIFIDLGDIKSMWEEGQLFSLCYTLFGFMGEAFGLATIVMVIFNKWAWKWKWIRLMHDIPVLLGKYNGELTSDYDGEKRCGTLMIEQTFLSVAVQVKTEESSSRSITASFYILQNVQYLIYNYQSDPRGEIQNRSPIHYGTVMLNVSDPCNIDGNYFTGRKTRGSMRFEAMGQTRV